jgi:hypothetical protein
VVPLNSTNRENQPAFQNGAISHVFVQLDFAITHNGSMLLFFSVFLFSSLCSLETRFNMFESTARSGAISRTFLFSPARVTKSLFRFSRFYGFKTDALADLKATGSGNPKDQNVAVENIKHKSSN